MSAGWYWRTTGHWSISPAPMRSVPSIPMLVLMVVLTMVALFILTAG